MQLPPVVVPSIAPIHIEQVELTDPLQDISIPALTGRPFAKVRLLVRLQHQPLGYVSFDVRGVRTLEAGEIASGIWTTFGDLLGSKGLERGDLLAGVSIDGTVVDGTVGAGAPLISVVMCTRNRPDGAALTLGDIVQLEYEPFEIIVVDNASRDDSTKKMIDERYADDPRVRYVREDKPGLSFARNTGLAAANGSITAYTDDDVRVDRHWLTGVLKGFRSRDDVGCVTGLVPTAEISNAVQLYFDQHTTWGTHLERREYDLVDNRDDSVLYPYSAGIFGTGANFAFDTATIRSVGGFDEALGAGAPTGGGEDLDAFIKILHAGKAIVQEPSSIIWHVHRSEIEQLNKQMFYYGVGLGAFIFKYLLKPGTALQIARRLVPGVRKIGSISATERERQILPARVLLTELLGMAYGPIAYLRGVAYRRRTLRRAGLQQAGLQRAGLQQDESGQSGRGT